MTGRAGAAESRRGPELRTVMLRQEWNVSLNQQESVSNLEEDGGGGGQGERAAGVFSTQVGHLRVRGGGGGGVTAELETGATRRWE